MGHCQMAEFPAKKLKTGRKKKFVARESWWPYGHQIGRKEAEKFSPKKIAVNVYITSEKHEEKGSHSWSI